jgi:hypothetical protein
MQAQVGKQILNLCSLLSSNPLRVTEGPWLFKKRESFSFLRHPVKWSKAFHCCRAGRWLKLNCRVHHFCWGMDEPSPYFMLTLPSSSPPPDNKYIVLDWRNVHTDAMHIVWADCPSSVRGPYRVYISYCHRIAVVQHVASLALSYVVYTETK